MLIPFLKISDFLLIFTSQHHVANELFSTLSKSFRDLVYESNENGIINVKVMLRSFSKKK
ncbi:CLUMA_CG012342, isoform A [Clunio marinus]|uniref:CLUMA_CG012342, isoform A n=1 Tax=Clunio marinus TaxID=568069 RepID=A0A1J1IFY9_9DIPT|nr:CLUMA_CG012342, isoform A [Clunio marinus]